MAHWLQHTSRDGDMQLHVHSQIAHTAKTATDGKWRAPDSLGYNEHIGAVAAIVSQHLEEALTRRFGLAWEARDDGHGFEIKGISGPMMRLFSSRRESITADLRARAAQFEQRVGRKPSQRELARLAQASNFKTRNAKHGTLDFAQLHCGWADKLARTLGVSLASVAPSVWHDGGGHAGARTRGPGDPGPGLSQLEVSRAAQKAVALAQQEKSTWTRADLIKYLGRVLPRSGMDPAAAAALLEDLADRALRSEFEPVACLEAPEPAEVPRQLAARGRAQHLPAARRRAVRDARAAHLGTAHARPRARRRRAAHGPRRRRARARRGPCAARPRAGRPRASRARRARRAGPAHADRAARGSGRRRAVGADRRQARLGDQRASRIWQNLGAGRGRPGMGGGRAGPGHRDHAVPVGAEHPGRRGPGVVQHRPVPRPSARPARCPRPRQVAARRPDPDRRGLHGLQPRPGRHHRPGRGQRAPR